MRRRGSLRRQILLRVTALVVLGFGVVTVASAAGLYWFLMHRVDAQLRVTGGIIRTHDVDLAGLIDRTSGRPLPPTPVVHVVELRRADGTVVEIARPSDLSPAVPALSGLVPSLADPERGGEPFWIPGDPGFRAVALPAADGATLLVAAPLEPVRQIVVQLLLFEAFLCLTLLAVVGVLGHRAVSRGLRPLELVTATADAIAAGDHTRRVPEVGSGDEVGRLSRAVNAMLTQLVTALDGRRRSEDRLRRFVADASHELRTPLTPIRGYVQLLRSGAIDAAGAPDALRRVDEETARMSGLIEEMLALARHDERQPLRDEVVDLAAVVHEGVADSAVLDPERPISVRVPDRCPVRGDPTGMRQVVGNLLANVRAHTPPGTPATVELTRAEGCVRLVVGDEGPGMDPEAAARAFDRFYRADPARSRTVADGGFGLGLSIVHDVVAQHAGRVGLDSTPGRGTAVTVVLPEHC